MNGSASIQHVFVYGTLKRGQCRESQWPRQPLQVRAAYVLGKLYDLGDYPAMLPGSDKVAGEVWSFSENDVAPTLRVLDEIEGYRNASSDLYTRVVVDSWLIESEQTLSAMTYHYAQPAQLLSSLRIKAAVSTSMCQWPR